MHSCFSQQGSLLILLILSLRNKNCVSTAVKKPISMSKPPKGSSAMELSTFKSSTNNALLGGGDIENGSAPLTELQRVKKEKDALEAELRAIRRLLDEKAPASAKKTDLESMVS